MSKERRERGGEMRILVCSDSHGTVGGMLEAVEREHPSLVLHLGDLLRDAGDLAYRMPELAVCQVPGNCDGWTGEPKERYFEVEGRKILMGHGHQWQVKSGYEGAIAVARRQGADILLFGHTHRAYCQQEDGLWVMNPGSIRTGPGASYGMILLEKEKTLCYTTVL